MGEEWAGEDGRRAQNGESHGVPTTRASRRLQGTVVVRRRGRVWELNATTRRAR